MHQSRCSMSVDATAPPHQAGPSPVVGVNVSSLVDGVEITNGTPVAEVVRFSDEVMGRFASHADTLRVAARERRAAVQLRHVVADREMQEAVSVEDTLGKRQPGDEFQGDVNLRTLRTLLSIIDGRGFERSPHQMRFHSSFERASARVVYRQDWETQRPTIMKKNGWATCPGEVMIRCRSPPVSVPSAPPLPPAHCPLALLALLPGRSCGGGLGLSLLVARVWELI